MSPLEEKASATLETVAHISEIEDTAKKFIKDLYVAAHQDAEHFVFVFDTQVSADMLYDPDYRNTVALSIAAELIEYSAKCGVKVPYHKLVSMEAEPKTQIIKLFSIIGDI